MKDIFPINYVSEDDWDDYLRENVPSLASLWNQGKFEAFETWKALNNVTYDDYHYYLTFTSGLYYAPYMPFIKKGMPKTIAHELASVQPMSESAGTVLSNAQSKILKKSLTYS
jgi:hypothetical protein